MAGTYAISRYLWLGALLLAGAACGQSASAPADLRLHFKVTVSPIPSEITSITADGVPQPIDDSTGVRMFVYEHVYANYAVAQQSPPITFEFWAGSTLSNTGQAAPGFCARECTLPKDCPTPDETTDEEIEVYWQMAFDLRDFTCFTCKGGDRAVTGCA